MTPERLAEIRDQTTIFLGRGQIALLKDYLAEVAPELLAEVERLRAALLAQRAACVRWLEAEAANWIGDDENVSPEVSAAVWQALTGAAAYFRGDSPPPAAPE